MGLLKLSFQLLFYTVLVVFLIVVIPGLPPDFKYETYSVRTPRKLDGKLTQNNILNKAELLLDGQFIGGESVALRGDDVFTGVIGGNIIKIDTNGKLKNVVKLGGDCDGTYKARCARPMGLRFNTQGKLLVADAYNGLYEVDVDTGKAIQLLSTNTPLADGLPVNFLNDLDIGKDGNVYITDTSTVAKYDNVYLEVLGDATGRLVQFNLKTKKIDILINGLHYANGVQLSKNEDFLVVCESNRGRLYKYHLKGSKKGTKELFIDGLPGVPDNVRSNGKGGFYISLVTADTEEHPLVLRYLGPIPFIRKLVLRSQNGILKTLEAIDAYSPNDLLKQAHTYVSHLGPFGNLLNLPRKVIIVDVDENGNIIGSLQNTDGKMGHISEISLGPKYAYFGTPADDKLWRIKSAYLK